MINQNVSYLYTMSDDNAVISYDIEGEKRYFLNNFYVCGNEGKVPISIATDHVSTTTDFENAYGTSITGIPARNPIIVGANSGTHLNNHVMLVAKEVFPINPKSFYRIRLRGNADSSSQVRVGILTFPSYPVLDVLNINNDVNLNESYNMSRFASGYDGVGIFPEADSGQTVITLSNLLFTPLNSTGISWDEKVGYFSKYAWGGQNTIDPAYQLNTTDGTDISSFKSINPECYYFSPVINCNISSTSQDSQRAIFDMLVIEEFKDMYVL